MSRTILVIDDDVDLLDVMEVALVYEGFDVVISPVATDCESLIKLHKIDLIIIDYLLKKGLNGGEVCHQLKSSQEFKDLPIIIFSAYPRVIQSFGSYGCDAFIAKPFDLSDIISQISTLLYRPGLTLKTN